jgi:deoxycytidine triphosphate deaminase
MVLGPKKLLELVKTQNLVEGLSERELTSPEGAGFDLRLGEVYRIKGSAFLGETERKTPSVELVAKYDGDYKNGNQLLAKLSDRMKKREAKLRKVITKKVVIKPGDFYLVKTIESFNVPANLTVNFKPRTTTFRSGLFLRTGNVAPGYKGQVTFALKNEGPCRVTIEMGARFVHAQFEEVKGGGSLYRGQWQGGRVTARKKERQV